jgi:hypothetical protein
VVGRESKYSLYDQDLVTFEGGAVGYDHRDAAGFIKLNALRLRTLGQRKKKLGLWGPRIRCAPSPRPSRGEGWGEGLFVPQSMTQKAANEMRIFKPSLRA